MNPYDLNNQPEAMDPGFLAPAPETENYTLPRVPASLPPEEPKYGRRWLLGAGLVILIAVVGGALLWHFRRPAAKPTVLTPVSVRLEWLNGPRFAGMDVAKDKGYYQAAGLNVDLEEFQANTDVNKEVASGAADFGVSTPLEVILARDKGENNKAVAAIYQTSAYSIVAQKKSNIKSPADFKGKVLGNIGDNNEANITYAALLAKVGLDPTDATIKPIDFNVVKDFQTNAADTADIYRTDQTFLLDQAHITYDQVFPEQYGFVIYGDVLIASDAKITTHPDQVQAFVSATMRGWQYAIDHQSETLGILAKYENSSYEVPGYAKFSLSAIVPLIRPTGDQPLGNMQYVPWNRAYEGVKEVGLVTKSFDPSDFYTSKFIK